MAKYKIGDELKLKRGEDTVKSKVLFVAPVDGYGEQHYLCEVYSLHANGGKKMLLSLQKEKTIDEYFELRI